MSGKMATPSEPRNMSVLNRRGFLIASPAEERVSRMEQSREDVRAGYRAANIASIAGAVSTLAAVRMIPWAKANLHYTAQALIVTAASLTAYVHYTDKALFEYARKNSFECERNNFFTVKCVRRKSLFEDSMRKNI